MIRQSSDLRDHNAQLAVLNEKLNSNHEALDSHLNEVKLSFEQQIEVMQVAQEGLMRENTHIRGDAAHLNDLLNKTQSELEKITQREVQ